MVDIFLQSRYFDYEDDVDYDDSDDDIDDDDDDDDFIAVFWVRQTIFLSIFRQYHAKMNMF